MHSPTILVTGGAGYIGSHTVRALKDAGMLPVVFDNLSAGHRQAVPDDVPLIVGDLLNEEEIIQAMDSVNPHAVVHFAAFIEAGESMRHPGAFYRNNVVGSLNLLSAMERLKVNRLVFSSTAAVYGEPSRIPIPEDAPQHPVNPYGASKWTVERILSDYATAHGLNSIALRYFNACGAHPIGDIGEAHPQQTHLIELALMAALGKRDHMLVFGSDYDTPDGTAIRDYIHVCDLANAHLVALEALCKDDIKGATAFNVGVGKGFSVLEVLDAVDQVVGRPISRILGERRPGDPAILVSDPNSIERVLGWKANITDLHVMIESAWLWHSTHPEGFPASTTEPSDQDFETGGHWFG